MNGFGKKYIFLLRLRQPLLFNKTDYLVFKF